MGNVVHNGSAKESRVLSSGGDHRHPSLRM